jgi:hypothetical protein
MQEIKFQNEGFQTGGIQGLHLDEAGEAASSRYEVFYLDRPFIWKRGSSG